MNNSTAKAKPKMTVKNGVVYGDALSAQEKKRIVMQKKKDKKAKKVRKSAQQTIPYVEMCRDGICKVNSRLYTKSIAFEDINYQLAQNEDKTAIFDSRERLPAYGMSCLRMPYLLLSVERTQHPSALQRRVRTDG